MSIAIAVCSILFTGVVCFLLGSAYQYKHYKIDGSTSDGYHTFDELYYYRLLYNANMVNLIQYINDNYPGKLDIKVYKSYKHSDGELCFGGGWFIVVMETPVGQITNHYENKYFDMFCCPFLDVAPVWDGHTPQEAAERLDKLNDYIISQLNGHSK